jgi:orotate phosphoribosyltransferase
MKSIEQIVASHLLEIKAVKLDLENPFTWASGWKSPIYCDNRKILSYPAIRKEICGYIVDTIKRHFDGVDVIAGVATGAIAYGAIVADILNKPFVYIRSSPKSHGMCNQVEGVINPGQTAVVIEDLISTGMSSMGAVEALTKSGALIKGMVAIFSYNFDVSRRSFENANVELHTLSNYDTLIDIALSSKYIKESDVESLKNWRFSPETWRQNL